MYYEERIINGVLMCRQTPRGKWTPVAIEIVTQRLIEARAAAVEAAKQAREEAWQDGYDAGGRIPRRMYR
jgi:hypothetical protein